MPWLAGLYTMHTKKPRFKCDASLISAKVAISSASCAYNGRIMMRPKKLLLQLGRSNTDPTEMLTQKVNKLIVHPDFNTNEVNVPEPDILLAVMKKSIAFGPTVRSICMTPLRSSAENLIGSSGMMVGWQRASIDLLAKAVPRLNQVPVSSSKRCMNGFEADDKFCSMKTDSDRSCDVAPGTGLVVKGKRDWKLRALVSIPLYDPITKQCNTNSRFVFTDLGQHSDWIESMVKKQNPLPLISDLTLDTSLDDFDFPFF
jgi:secreted trypsin-like serine protease